MTRGSTTPGAQRAVSRRTVVRAGSTAAWAVPAISVATMTSGYAAVSGQATLQGSQFFVQCNANQKRLHVVIGPIRNTGSAATGGPVTVVFSAPESAQTSMGNPYVNGTQNNWTYVGASSSGDTDDYTFVSKKGSLKPNETTGALSFQLTMQSASCPIEDFTYVATSPNSTPTAGSTSASGSSS
jgi:hypothetical protein